MIPTFERIAQGIKNELKLIIEVRNSSDLNKTKVVREETLVVDDEGHFLEEYFLNITES